MIFPESLYGTKDEDFVLESENNFVEEPQVKEPKRLKLNVFGYLFNLALSLTWFYLVYHFAWRFSTGMVGYEHIFFRYTRSREITDKFIAVCNMILCIFHWLYCLIPRLGVEMHSTWQIIIPVIAVYGQILVIFYYDLLREEHYGNYLWSIPLILGTVSVGILTNSENDEDVTILPYFKPWVIRKDEPERTVDETIDNTDSIKCDV